VSDTVDQRVRAASLLRDYGHEFVEREFTGDQLEEIARQVGALLVNAKATPPRTRSYEFGGLGSFRSSVPEFGSDAPHNVFAGSLVSGSTNPMGLGAKLWRDGDDVIVDVTLGSAFEGAPGRAHGGVVAALLDEAIGIVLTLQGLLALTAQLSISYRAATPVNEPLRVRAWLASRDGRKLTLRAEVTAQEVVVVEANALFIEVDPAGFRESEDGE
jgi:acyl-coenzyme A thioesterase PaaI-like protein